MYCSTAWLSSLQVWDLLQASSSHSPTLKLVLLVSIWLPSNHMSLIETELLLTRPDLGYHLCFWWPAECYGQSYFVLFIKEKIQIGFAVRCPLKQWHEFHSPWYYACRSKTYQRGSQNKLMLLTAKFLVIQKKWSFSSGDL